MLVFQDVQDRHVAGYVGSLVLEQLLRVGQIHKVAQHALR